MRTVIIIGIGFVLLGAFLGAARLFAGTGAMKTAAAVFIVLWFVAASINLYVGVAHAGYGFMEELPILLLIFAPPAALAAILYTRL